MPTILRQPLRSDPASEVRHPDGDPSERSSLTISISKMKQASGPHEGERYQKRGDNTRGNPWYEALIRTRIPIAFLVLFLAGCQSDETNSYVDWPVYLGSPALNIFSTIDQIDTSNVQNLRPVWTYRSGDPGEMECNTIIIDGKLFGVTATKEVFALDGTNGKELWRFSPSLEKNILRSRGVSYWREGEDERVFTSYREWLYALDASTGEPIQAFGDSGRVSLKMGLDGDVTDKYVVSRTPGAIYKNLIVMPLALSESAGAAPGYIQAFDVRTGELVWKFRTVPFPGEEGYETWPESAYADGVVGGANSWAGMAIDQERGIIFAPTGSAAPDFFGGNRAGQNLFANTLLALDANTGERIWHHQMVHHDLWDRDLPSPPALSSILFEGQKRDVVTQTTKTGHLYIFDRATGESLYPIEEFEVPASAIPEESAWPVQRYPTWPAPFSRQSLTEEDINPYSPDRDSLLKIFQAANKGHFVPLSETPTLLFPGCDGGAEWGGTAVDPEGILYVNSNEMAWLFTMSRTEKSTETRMVDLGEKLYLENCASCHLHDRSGNPASGYPSLIGIGDKMDAGLMSSIIVNGRGRMTGFSHLTDEEVVSVVRYVQGLENQKVVDETPGRWEQPWKFDGYHKFLDSEGNPGISPPWGQLTAIDLATGEQKWQKPLGDLEAYQDLDISPTGTENYGGPLVTSGGLLFIAATKDSKFRAFSKSTGRLLWETDLPASGFATPSTYMINGRQYVVIACGGSKLGVEAGDALVAFALP